MPLRSIPSYFSGTKRVRKLVNLSPFGNVSSSFEYDYDDKGRPVKITSNEGIRSFTYDAASQLVGWTDVIRNGSKYTHAYDYDSRKNRVSFTDNDHRDNYETNNVNQYKSVSDYEFGYDKNGNMLFKKNKKSRAKDIKYVFSEENVLMQAETANERYVYAIFKEAGKGISH
jgi:YD repeat-containing protein